MKKRYLLLVVVIAIVLLLPKFIATQVTSSITNLVASINKHPMNSAQIVEINEGWFSSEATINVGINFAQISATNIENMPAGETQFLIDVKASHGPVIITDGFALALVKWQATFSGDELKPIMQWDYSNALYKISGIHQLWNVSQFEDQVQAFTLDSKAQNIQADFAGLVGNGSFSNSQFDYATFIGNTTIGNNQNSVLMKDVAFTMQIDGNYLQAMQGKLFDTDVTLKIGQFQFTDLVEQLDLMELLSTNFELVARVDKESATANIDQRFELKTARFDDYQIEDLKLDLAINRLSLLFVEEYQKIANQQSGQDPLIMQQELMKFSLNNMLELLGKDPEVNLKNISASLPEGKFNINAKAQTVGITKLPENLQDPEFWLTHLLAEANLHSDKAVAELFATNYVKSQIMQNPQSAEMSPQQIDQIATQQAPAVLDAFIQQGLIVEENDRYKASMTLKDKQAVLNGTPIPLPF